MKSSQWPRGELNRPLMKPGETYEIMAAVFNDKSYEATKTTARGSPA